MEIATTQPGNEASEVEPRLEERACSIFEKDAVDGAVVRQTMKASYDTINSNREWEAKVGKHEPSKSQVVPAVDGAAYQGTSVAFKVEDEPINSDKSGVEPNSNRPVRKARLKRRFDPSFIEDIKDEDDLEHDQPYKYDNKMTEQNIETTKAVGNDQRKKVMQPILQIVVPCPIDLVCPRKMRTYVEVRPRTSRASIAKLKQAAAGCLPLPPTVLGLLEDEEKQDDECEKVAYHNGRRLEQPLETRSYKVKAMAYATANAKELQQTPEQRHLVKAMSDAPPDIRNIMLRNLISQRFGGEQAKSIHLIASLPREQQNMVVQHLLSRMTPQQRHTLTQMKPPQQAELLQRFYERFVLPNLISSNPQKLSSGVGSRPFLNTEQAAMTGQGRSTTTVLNNGNLLAWQRSNDGPNLEPMGRPQPGIPSCYSLQSQTYCPMGPAMYSGVPGHSMIAKDDGPKSYPMQFPSTCQLHNGVHNSMEQNQGAPSLAQQSNSHDDLHVVSSTNKTDFGGLKVSELLGYAGFDDMDALQDAVNYFQNEGI